MQIFNLLTLKNSKLSGAMSPVLFAQEACRELNFALHGMVRVYWEDETMQLIDDEGGYDTLVMLEKRRDDFVLRMFADTGVDGIPVALYFSYDKSMTLSGVYKKRSEFHKPSEEALRAVFEMIAQDMSLILPKEA